MSETAASQTTQYPLVAYNFRVTVGETTMCFAEVSGLVREYQSLTYRHGFSFSEGEQIATFRFDQYSEVTLSRGVFPDARGELYQWLESRDKKLVTVQLYDADEKVVVTWKIQKAIPVSLEAPSFQADSNEVAIETLTLMASGISAGYE